MGLAALFAIIYLIDQGTKLLALVYLSPGDPLQVLGDFFQLTLLGNPGFAFGLRIGHQTSIHFISILLVIFIFTRLFKLRQSPRYRIAAAFILAGAIGNFTDRIIRGHVIDFIDIDFFNLHLPGDRFFFLDFYGFFLERLPVFNFADLAVAVGMGLMIHAAVKDHAYLSKLNEANQGV